MADPVARINELAEQYRLWHEESQIQHTQDTIAVDEVVARVASFYEKIRGIVDWREEHLLRKTAIERILKRRMFVHRFDENFAEQFLAELVRGGHFPNRRITLEKVREIHAILEKYVFILEGEQAKKLEPWLLSIGAVEIEEALSVPRRERALIDCMTNDLAERVVFTDRKGTFQEFAENEKIVQIFVATQRALFKLDTATITFHILERFSPHWKNPTPESLEHAKTNIRKTYEKIQTILEHEHAEQFYQVAEQYDTPYLILHDILSADPSQFVTLLEDPDLFEQKVRQAYDARHTRLRSRLKRAALYSTISIFVTKIVFVVLLEVPIERILFNTETSYLALGLSVVIPPILMVLLATNVETTSRENFDRVVVEVSKVLRQTTGKKVHTVFLERKQAHGISTFIYGLYAISFLLTFGIAFWVLRLLHFSVPSIVVFLMFVSLVLFAGTRIRHRASELMIEPEHEGFIHNMVDTFFLPMVQMGRWLSGQISRYNMVALSLTFFIEVPFQLFIDFLDQWRRFLREKRQEIH